MTPGQKMAGLGLMVILLLVLGASCGVWFAARYYRPLIDAANRDLATTRSTRDNLEALAGEQGRKLGDLVRAGKDRELAASLAQEKAAHQAQSDYAAANQLLRGRSGGDPAKAATDIIDQELGL